MNSQLDPYLEVLDKTYEHWRKGKLSSEEAFKVYIKLMPKVGQAAEIAIKELSAPSRWEFEEPN